MSRSLDGKAAIVTGASRGIGRRIAETLAARGARVIVNYPFESEAPYARDVVAAIGDRGGEAVAIAADVTRISEIEALFAAAETRFGGVDIVVSNAGGAAGIIPIKDVSEEEYDRATALNAKAHFFVLRQCARAILIASSTTAMPYPGSAVYAGAKAAAELYVRVLAKELGSRGITANAISPGPVDTEAARAAGQVEERFAMAIRMTPLGRLGQPEDIADVVAFVASDDARWITGQNLRVGGGIV